MILFETITDFLSQYGRIYIKGNNVSLRCPLCGDSKKSKLKKRFTVTHDNGSAFYNCFNCSRSGTFSELYSELKGISLSEAIRIVDVPDFDDIAKSFKKETPVVTEKIDSEDFSHILNDCLSKYMPTQSYIDGQYKKKLLTFIEDRKIPDEYDVYIAIKGDYKGRIIIPVYNDNDLVYFQGRAISDDVIPKFKNPHVEKTDIIMNVDKFHRDMFIIVTEGIIDAMMIEYNQGTCVLGGSVSDEFLSKLLLWTDEGIIIAVDNDERGEIERNKLITNSKYGKLIRYFIPPNPIKDLNEYKIKKKIGNMYDTIVEHSVDYWTLSVKSNLVW